MSEAGSGSDAFALKTKAVVKGDHYEITGQKLWITNGNEAEIFIVFATIDPSAGYKGITAFIVEKVLKVSPSAKGRQTRHSRQFNDRINFRFVQSSKGKRPRRSR